MKVIFQLILLIIPILVYGQQTVCVYNDFKVLGNDTINVTSNNIKEGTWMNYEIAYNSIECYTSQSCYHQEVIRYIISRGNFSKGVRIGEWKYYYPTGEIKRIDFYSDEGEREGTSTEYYKDATVRSKQNWKNNKLDWQVVYFENGKTKYETKFEENKIKSFEIYYNTGELKFKGMNVVDWKIENLILFSKNGEEIKTRIIGLGELLSNEDLIEYL